MTLPFDKSKSLYHSGAWQSYLLTEEIILRDNKRGLFSSVVCKEFHMYLYVLLIIVQFQDLMNMNLSSNMNLFHHSPLQDTELDPSDLSVESRLLFVLQGPVYCPHLYSDSHSETY